MSVTVVINSIVMTGVLTSVPGGGTQCKIELSIISRETVGKEIGIRMKD